MRPILILCILSFAAGVLQAQSRFPNVTIYSGSGSYINEPTICINPKNLNQVVAGSVLNDFYHSENGGVTWTHGNLSCPWGVWGDPSLVVDTNSNFYYFHLAYPPSPGWWIDRIICQKSADGGLSWSSGTYMGKGTSPHAQDKEWAVVDRNNNNIYVTWTQFDNYGSTNTADSSIILFAKSTDAGLTWTNPAKRISKVAGDCHDDDNTVEGAVPCVGPNGEVYVTWSGPLGLVFNRSTDQGVTWLDSSVIVSSNPGGWNYSISGIDRSNGMPVTCCDLSQGPHRGTIYTNWSDQRNGPNDTDVWLVKSTDGGNSWSSPKRVNDDPPGKQQFFNWMTVDQATGYIYIIFYDRRNYANDQTDVYLASSRDGGETFDNMRISAAPFTPNPAVFFGDYTNITAHNNIVRPIWAALSGSNAKSINTALIDSVYSSSVTWEGSVSIDWSNPWNWSPRQVPKQDQDVNIPAVPVSRFSPTVAASGFSCNNLTISAEAKLTIPDGIIFTINGNLNIQK
ncbi:MAG: exo-alpha-sialidase [Bacteroidetes bacterium]|nr:exo-alpha-sialidase [Bacteroidota bacterium]